MPPLFAFFVIFAINRGAVYRVTLNYDGFDVCKTFAKLARTDIEDAVSLANSISLPVIRSEELIAIGGKILGQGSAE